MSKNTDLSGYTVRIVKALLEKIKPKSVEFARKEVKG